MKPPNNLNTTAKARGLNLRQGRPPTARRVEIEFYPHSSWTIEVGNSRPAIPQRRNPLPPPAGARLPSGFAPIELVIAAETQKQALWQLCCRASLWSDQFV